MKRIRVIGLVTCFAVALALVAQQIGTSASAQEGKEKGSKKRVRISLPNYFGQIGLSNKQREEVYSVRRKFQPQIADLQKQILNLRAKERKEMEAVLTAEQQKELSTLLEEARKKRASRSKKRGSKKRKDGDN